MSNVQVPLLNTQRALHGGAHHLGGSVGAGEKPLERRRAYVARFRCDRDAGPAEFVWTFVTK